MTASVKTSDTHVVTIRYHGTKLFLLADRIDGVHDLMARDISPHYLLV